MSGTTRASSEPGGRGGAAPFSSGRFKGGGLGLGGNPSAVCKALKLCFCLAANGLCHSLPSLLDRRRRAFSCLAAPSDWLCWSPAGSRFGTSRKYIILSRSGSGRKYIILSHPFLSVFAEAAVHFSEIPARRFPTCLHVPGVSRMPVASGCTLDACGFSSGGPCPSVCAG